jgi:hypothetical protein
VVSDGGTAGISIVFCPCPPAGAEDPEAGAGEGEDEGKDEGEDEGEDLEDEGEGEGALD